VFDRYPIAPTLPASDIERARRWYAEKLGLEPTMEIPGAGLVYPAGGSPMGFLLYPSEHAGTARNTAAGWLVEDVESAVADLRSRGVEFEEFETGDIKTVGGIASAPDGGGKSAWFRDSEGNILNIAQLPPGMEMPGIHMSATDMAEVDAQPGVEVRG
jgi:catechol 2,3-dioxygenase-like lactoylglutathione lyase family enzyme